MQKLIGEGRAAFTAETAAEYAAERERYANRNRRTAILSLDDARANRLALDWDAAPITEPNVLGITAFDALPLATLRETIDWGPFFIAWEMKGKYPQILDDPERGAVARELFDDAKALLDRIEAESLLNVRAVAGLWPAHADGDDLVLQTAGGEARLHTLRQQTEKTPGKPNRALADFVAPADSGRQDYLGGFCVSVHGAPDLVAAFRAEHDEYHAILAQVLADRLAEAAAERLHTIVRTDLWGYAPDEDLSNDDLIRERYRGIRPAPGYPAQPDHTEKRTLFRLLDAEANAGTTLTEHLAMQPASSVCGLYFAHPEAAYFNVGALGRDQVEDYARRKGMEPAEAERWLSPALGYEPPRAPLSGDGAAGEPAEAERA